MPGVTEFGQSSSLDDAYRIHGIDTAAIVDAALTLAWSLTDAGQEKSSWRGWSLFFEHFTDTSFAAECDGRLAGFLAGFISQSRPGEAYIHFVGWIRPSGQLAGLLLGLDGDRVRFIRRLPGA